MKGFLKILGIGVAVFALVGTASAATYTINQCGASAQAGFWEQAGAAVVQAALECDDAVLDGTDDKNLIIRGQNCTADATGTKDDTVYVRYQVVNSSYGCTNYDCELSSGWADPATCTFDGTPFDCTGAVDASCQIGCSDVACTEITATTVGYPTGRKGAPINGGSETFGPQGSASGFPITADTFYQGVVIPFGFIVNNAVTDAVCTYAGLNENAHLAYDKRGWECDPAEVDFLSCRGDYKCLDTDESGTGVCLDGNQDADLDATITGNETECVDASDCKINDVGPAITIGCEAQPLKNVSRLMALHILSDQVGNWSDFGPSFPNIPIVGCFRHGGSGSHQTMLDTVIRGDVIFKNVTRFTDPTGNFIWHYTSSSDLTRDCVAFYDGGFGYVDADKVMFRSKIAKGVHQLMYQGVAPSRLAVASGKYNFWSAQQCFLDSTQGCYGPEDLNIIDQIQTKAGDPTFLNFAGFGQRAYFWATQDEMTVFKSSGLAYPNR
jgi:hypothetical protein